MKNRIKSGKTMTFTAPTGGVVSGGFYKIGQLLVVALADVAQTLPFEGATTGVFASAPKTTGAAWAEGELLYWDNTTFKFTKTAGTNHPAASVSVAALSADTTGTIRLNGIAAANAS